MADTKITALTALTGADPANDVIPIVDVSDTTMAASGTTKKISVNNILGASGTATLASATITGDLTVDTTTLKVDSANNRVGIGTASPLGPFHLVTTAAGFSEAGYFENSQAVGANVGPRVSLLGAGSVAMSLIQSGWNAAANTDAYLAFLTRGSGGVNERYRIASDGVATWSNVGGVAGTAMTLNATGLGVGVTPSAGKGCLQLSSGINFPATQVASSDANTLDDYEEGTWTGTLKGSVTDPTIPVTATGRYTKIGRQVFVQIEFLNFSNVGAAGNITVTGLPFSGAGGGACIGIPFMNKVGTYTGNPIAYLTGTTIELYAMTSNSQETTITHNAGTGRYMTLSITYTV